jgi:hypothetical protein
MMPAVATMADSDPATAPTTAERASATPDDARRRRLRLARIRRAVLRGEYENELKLSVAADRLFERLRTDSPTRDARRPQ